MGLELSQDKSKLLMDHKIGIKQLDYCYYQKSFCFIDMNFDFTVVEMASLSQVPKKVFKGKIKIYLFIIYNLKNQMLNLFY